VRYSFDKSIGEARSELAMPIIFKGTVLGVLSLRDPRPHAFGQRDVSVIETIAFHLAVAIENATLFKQVDRRIRQLELLQSVTTQAIEELDVQAVLNYTVQATRHILSYSSVAVGLLAQDQEHLDLTIVHKLPDGEIESRIINATVDSRAIVGMAVQTGTLQLIKDVRGQSLAPLLATSQSALVVPIRARGKLIGVIDVESDLPGAFDNTDTSTLTILAAQLTTAIRGAGLFQQTQAQLHQISLFRRLADEAIVGIITRDANGLIDYANRAAADLLGYSSPEAMRNVPVRTLYPDEVWYQIDQQVCIQSMLEGGWSGEVTQQRQNGERIIVDMSLFPIYAPDGMFVTYGAILQNATDRRALTEATEHASARFQAIFEATTDGFIVWDDQWNVVLVNPAATRFLEMAPEALIGHSREDGAANPRLAAIIDANENERIELPSGERCVVQVRSLSWHSDSASGYLTVIYDMTSHVALEEAREETISMLVHDLRSPLANVIGGIELAQTIVAEESDRERALHFLKIANRGIHRVLEVADSLLDITKLEAGQMALDCKPLNVQTVIEDVINNLATTAQSAHITVVSSIGSDLPPVSGDPALIRRALNNLLDNAIKFSPDGAQVTITAQAEPNNALRFSVLDSGPGVAKQYQRIIFEKYGQVPGLDGRRRGTGLGLAFCRLVAEAHQGRIWVEPRPGGGSIFSFTVVSCTPRQETQESSEVSSRV
jgi:PAS domain S-box-containing protein